MAGYWPSSFFACLWTETESRSINILTEQTWAINGFIIWLSHGNFSCGTWWVVLSGQGSSIFAT